MNLTVINKRLEELSTLYPQKIKELSQAEYKYNMRFMELIIHSGMGNQAQREAEATLACEQEGILEPLQILRADTKALYHEKDILNTLSANLRVLAYGEKEKGGEVI